MEEDGAPQRLMNFKSTLLTKTTGVTVLHRVLIVLLLWSLQEKQRFPRKRLHGEVPKVWAIEKWKCLIFHCVFKLHFVHSTLKNVK